MKKRYWVYRQGRLIGGIEVMPSVARSLNSKVHYRVVPA